jgi:hypothetical protein
MPLRPFAALLAGVLLTACSGGASPAPSDGAGGSAGVNESPTPSSLGALPACASPPAAVPAEVEGLVLPEGSIITKVTPQKPLVNVNAFVPLTPAAFEVSFREIDDVTILFSENEIYEAEMLISNGTFRNFHKATATCQRGSTVLTVVAPEVDAEGLPLPSRATATPIP